MPDTAVPYVGVQSIMAWLSIALPLVTMGCQFSASENRGGYADQKTASSQQLIIKFKPGTINCDANGIAQLSDATRVPLEYVRPMSASACVIKQFGDKKDGFIPGQKLLRQHPDVEWLELDAIRKAF